MHRPLITITTDFGVQSQGVGAMEIVARDIAEDAHVVHLMHGLPDFDLRTAARTMETLQFLPVGYHVCVVDPGVGTARHPIIIKTKRGDHFIGPDNGVFIPATNILGGCEKVVAITNRKYMRETVSPIFHGRDIFAPAAAHLASGILMEAFGELLEYAKLAPGPYEEATLQNGTFDAEIICINKFGSFHLNILQRDWDAFGLQKDEKVALHVNDTDITLPFVETFGDVPKGMPLILKDDYGRIEVAVNLGNFIRTYGGKVGDRCTVGRAS